LYGVVVVETNNNMKNLHLLPTTKPSVLYEFSGQYYYHPIPQINFRSYHIYITSDEEIKDRNCWVTNGEDIFKPLDDYSLEYANNYWEKIILTTDQDLDGIQAIPDEFLEWFVKNPSCEYVEIEIKPMFPMYSTFIESIDNPPFYGNLKRKIIIPQEEPKQCKCGSNWVNTTNKDNPFCFHCGKPLTQEPKQETAEEAAKRIYGSDVSKDVEYYAFLNGAKWQQERMYSEEVAPYKGDLPK
jgi:hypothetical protein